ncbi:MAG: AraC family transcriptional regulator [Proteobacteria bacterium]|nr:AraC family transcriptional regulator [Pseudomonadota bacterium]MCK4869308.1 AraC family transcriptional regulator [Alphaproteobacteria bacterium]
MEPNRVQDGTAPIVLASAATGIVDYIERLHGDVDRIFGHSGIAPSMAGAPTLKLKLSSFCNLFEEGSRLTGNDNFGLWFGNQFQPRDLGLWGYAIISSPTLGSALENMVDFFAYHQASSLMRLVHDEDGLVRLEYQIQAPDIIERRQDAELSLGMFLNVFRECYGAGWAPEEVHFEHPNPVESREHENAFGAPVYFSQPANALLFRPEIMDRPMPGRDLNLMTMMQTCLEQLSALPEGETSLISQVRTIIRTRLPNGYPPLDTVAHELRLSPAAIKRELSREGVVYKDLVEMTRRDLSMMYMKQRQLPFSEIAFLLGYSELSAFSRAVRRWTGESPRTVRARLLGN